MIHKIRPQVMILILVLGLLAGYALYSDHSDVAGMGIVAMAGALTKLVEKDD